MPSQTNARRRRLLSQAYPVLMAGTALALVPHYAAAQTVPSLTNDGGATITPDASFDLPNEGDLDLPSFTDLGLDAADYDQRFFVDLGDQSRVITYDSFDLSADALADFVATGTSGNVTAVNRVTTADASDIFGLIRSEPNVSVWLVNPEGVTFGADAVFSGASLVVSTLDFPAGFDILANLASPSFETTNTDITAPGVDPLSPLVINLGASLTSTNGNLVLVGESVQVLGSVESNGTTALIGARQVNFSNIGSPLSFTITEGVRILESAAGVQVTGSVTGGSVIAAAGGINAGEDGARTVMSTLLNVDTATLTATEANGSIILATTGYGGTMNEGGVTPSISITGSTLAADDDGDGTPTTGSILVDSAYDASLVAVDADAGGSITLNAGNDLLLDGGTLTAGGAADLDAVAVATVGASVDAGDLLTVNANAIVLGDGDGPTTISSDDAINLVSSTTITDAGITTVQADADADEGGNVAADMSLSAVGDITLDQSSLFAGTTTNRTAITIDAVDTAPDPDTFFAVTVDTIRASSVTTVAATNAGDLQATSVTLGSVDVSDPLSIVASVGDIDFGSITAGSSVTLDAATAIGIAAGGTGNITAGGTVTLDATTGPVVVGDISATGQAVYVESGAGGTGAAITLGDVTALSLSNNNGTTTLAATALTLGDVTTTNALDLAPTNDLTFASLTSTTGGVTVNAGGAIGIAPGGTGNITAADTVTLDAATGPVVVGDISATGQAVYVESGAGGTGAAITLGDVTALSLTNNNGTTTLAATALTLGDVTTTNALDLAPTNDLTFASLTSTTGGVTVNAGGAIGIAPGGTGNITAADTVTLVATTGPVVAGDISATGQAVYVESGAGGTGAAITLGDVTALSLTNNNLTTSLATTALTLGDVTTANTIELAPTGTLTFSSLESTTGAVLVNATGAITGVAPEGGDITAATNVVVTGDSMNIGDVTANGALLGESVSLIATNAVIVDNITGTGGSVTLDSLNSSVVTADITATGQAVYLDAASATSVEDVSAATLTNNSGVTQLALTSFSAFDIVLSDEVNIVTTAAGIDIDSAQSTTGDVTLNAAGNLTFDSVTANVGQVSLTSAASVLGSGTPDGDITSGSLVTVSGTAVDIDDVLSTGQVGGESVSITSTNSLTVGDITATTGSTTLTSTTGSVTGGNILATGQNVFAQPAAAGSITLGNVTANSLSNTDPVLGQLSATNITLGNLSSQTQIHLIATSGNLTTGVLETNLQNIRGTATGNITIGGAATELGYVYDPMSVMTPGNAANQGSVAFWAGNNFTSTGAIAANGDTAILSTGGYVYVQGGLVAGDDVILEAAAPNPGMDTVDVGALEPGNLAVQDIVLTGAHIDTARVVFGASPGTTASISISAIAAPEAAYVKKKTSGPPTINAEGPKLITVFDALLIEGQQILPGDQEINETGTVEINGQITVGGSYTVTGDDIILGDGNGQNDFLDLDAGESITLTATVGDITYANTSEITSGTGGITLVAPTGITPIGGGTLSLDAGGGTQPVVIDSSGPVNITTVNASTFSITSGINPFASSLTLDSISVDGPLTLNLTNGDLVVNNAIVRDANAGLTLTTANGFTLSSDGTLETNGGDIALTSGSTMNINNVRTGTTNDPTAGSITLNAGTNTINLSGGVYAANSITITAGSLLDPTLAPDADDLTGIVVGSAQGQNVFLQAVDNNVPGQSVDVRAGTVTVSNQAFLVSDGGSVSGLNADWTAPTGDSVLDASTVLIQVPGTVEIGSLQAGSADNVNGSEFGSDRIYIGEAGGGSLTLLGDDAVQVGTSVHTGTMNLVTFGGTADAISNANSTGGALIANHGFADVTATGTGSVISVNAGLGAAQLGTLDATANTGGGTAISVTAGSVLVENATTDGGNSSISLVSNTGSLIVGSADSSLAFLADKNGAGGGLYVTDYVESQGTLTLDSTTSISATTDPATLAPAQDFTLQSLGGNVNLTAATSLDVFSVNGVNISANGGSIDIGTATASGTLSLVATSGSLLLDDGNAGGAITLIKQGGTGVLDAGSLDTTAGGVTATSATSIEIDTVGVDAGNRSAGGLTTNSTTTTQIGSAFVTGAIDGDAIGAYSATTLDGASIVIDAASVDVGTATSGGILDMTATSGSLLLDDGNAGGAITLIKQGGTGVLDAGSLDTTAGGVTATSATSIEIDTVGVDAGNRSAGGLTTNSTTTTQIGSAFVTGAIDGDAIGAYSATTLDGASIVIDAASVDVGTATSGGILDMTATSGNLTLDDGAAAGAITLSTLADGGTVDIGSLTTTLDGITINSADIVTLDSVGTDVAPSTGGLTINSGTAAGAGNGDTVIGDAYVTGEIALTIDGDLTANTLSGNGILATAEDVAVNALADAGTGTLELTANSGNLFIDTGVADGDITLTKLGTTNDLEGITANDLTSNNGSITLDSATFVNLGTADAQGTTSILSRDTINIGTLITSGGLDLLSSEGDISIGSVTATNDVQANANGDLDITTGITASGGSIVLLAGGEVNSAGSPSGDLTAGEDIAVQSSGGIGLGALQAGDNITVRAVTGLSIGGAVTTGGGSDNTIYVLDPSQAGTLAGITTSTDEAADGDILFEASTSFSNDGAMTIAAPDGTLTLRNLAPGDVDTVIGASGTFALDEADLAGISAANVLVEAGDNALIISGFELDPATGSNLFSLASTGAITIDSAITGTGSNTLQIGQGEIGPDGLIDPATLTESITLFSNLGRISLPNGTVDLRAVRIVFGNEFFVSSLDGYTQQDAAEDVADAGSLLYTGGTLGDGVGGVYLEADLLRVAYSDFALFQNTALGRGGGVVLNPDGANSVSELALQLFSQGDDNLDSFALFGEVNGFFGRTAGILPNTVLEIGTLDPRLVRVTQSNSRVNGCVIGSPDRGCLIIDLPPPEITLIDERAAQRLISADDPNEFLNPLVGRGNEGLILDIAQIPVSIDTIECDPDEDPSCQISEDQQ